MNRDAGTGDPDMVAAADWRAHFEERAGILQYNAGLTRADAETRTRAEIYDAVVANGLADLGILGELVAANHRRHLPEVEEILHQLGLAGRAAPAWGFGHVIDEGGGIYRPAESVETECEAATIVPSFVDGLEDLVAHGLRSRRTLTRLGLATVVGATEIDKARDNEGPLLVFNDPLAWLRGNTHGIVVIDWKNIGAELEGVRALICSLAIAPRLYKATRRCWPRPVVATPPRKDLQHAA